MGEQGKATMAGKYSGTGIDGREIKKYLV